MSFFGSRLKTNHSSQIHKIWDNCHGHKDPPSKEENRQDWQNINKLTQLHEIRCNFFRWILASTYLRHNWFCLFLRSSAHTHTHTHRFQDYAIFFLPLFGPRLIKITIFVYENFIWKSRTRQNNNFVSLTKETVEIYENQCKFVLGQIWQALTSLLNLPVSM